MISLYSSAFNLILNSFDYEKSIDNFCNFADRVFIAVNKSKDETYQELSKLTFKYNNLFILSVDISYSDPLVDGKIKNAALKFAESHPETQYLVGADLDEIFPLKHRERWRELAELFLDYYNWNGVLVPSIDLYGSKETVRWQVGKSNKKWKWYLHKKGFNRGPVNFGLKENGLLNIQASDGTELIDDDGELVSCPRFDAHFDNILDCKTYYKELDESLIYVIHIGYLNFDKRIIRNNNFWEKQWKKCSGDESVIIDNSLEDFSKYKLENHGLELEDV